MKESRPTTSIEIPAGNAVVRGTLEIAANARHLIVFAHGLTSNSRSPRNRLVARSLLHRGFAVLLPDLTCATEPHAELPPRRDGDSLLPTANRLVSIIDWLGSQAATSGLRLGLFGAGSGAAAALVAAALRPAKIHAVVARGGRLDLADDLLAEVLVPTLMLVGSKDKALIDHNRKAGAKMRCKPMLEVIHGTNHLFAEPGKLEQVASISCIWFQTTLTRCA
ncbi:MAG: hypothetical protein DVB25_01370 [Verrucomicrobia bacterium]|nr:MAG: hypothetical protein DVB25_01370 [Verrucomicrobiota bacterium]